MSQDTSLAALSIVFSSLLHGKKLLGRRLGLMLARWITELIGSFAGFCTTLSLVPQLHRIWRSKSAHDLSLAMFSVFGLGICLWLLYGIGIHSPSVIAANSASLVLVIAIISLAIHYQRSHSAGR